MSTSGPAAHGSNARRKAIPGAAGGSVLVCPPCQCHPARTVVRTRDGGHLAKRTNRSSSARRKCRSREAGLRREALSPRLPPPFLGVRVTAVLVSPERLAPPARPTRVASCHTPPTTHTRATHTAHTTTKGRVGEPPGSPWPADHRLPRSGGLGGGEQDIPAWASLQWMHASLTRCMPARAPVWLAARGDASSALWCSAREAISKDPEHLLSFQRQDSAPFLSSVPGLRNKRVHSTPYAGKE